MRTEPQVNILLVDDQPNNLLALEALLDDLGQNLVKAHSGEEALRRLLEEDFALILLDVQMPGMDGFETAALIRDRDRSRHTPIIFLTAHERADVQMFKGYSLGAVDYLCKPLVPDILRSKVRVFIELHKKTEEVRQQAELLRDSERREHERVLAEEKQRWEMERLREESAKEKQVAAALAQKADELARTVAERLRAEEALREANRHKDEFLAMLAHELRNPLAPIRNALAILRLGRAATPKTEPAFEILERQVRHMTRLIDDLLDVSRITRGKIELRKEPLELGGVVAQAVESTRPLFAAQGHQLTVSMPQEPVWVLADPTRLEQVLANLLHNAAKYTDPGGRVWLTVERPPLPPGHRPGGAGEEVVLCVRDSGIGMARELVPRVFDLFMQGETSLDRSQGGLGIGLTLVREVVKMHGGSVHASSPGPGQGSEFAVRLPTLDRPAAGQPGPAQVMTPPDSPAHRILVVDDNPDAAQSLATLLELQGHEVRLAHDGPSALEAAQAFQPRVVLLDIGLPGMSGHEVARRLRDQQILKNGMLIAMTGYGQDEDRRRSYEAGFTCHLVKPVDPQELFRLLVLNEQ
jgi:signal transduction histidine kinase